MSHLKELDTIVESFRNDWCGFQPGQYPQYVDQLPEALQAELTTRLLTVDLEYHFNCPEEKKEVHQEWLAKDDSITPNVHLFKMLFPILRKHEDLLIQLAVIEYALRIHHGGENPNKESYFYIVKNSQARLADLLDETQTRIKNHQVDEDNTRIVERGGSTTPDLSLPVSLDIEGLPTTLGCFLLLSRLGQGGMGSVFRAIDLRVGAPVAVKVMRRNDPWSVYRFNEEFGWLSRLHHKNLVGLYDAFSEGEFRYFAMELVEGRSIDTWFQDKKREIGDSKKHLVAALTPALQQLAQAISFLHSRGLLHRDIKPSNVMIDGSDRVVLLDLGLTVSAGGSIYKKYVEQLSPISDFPPSINPEDDQDTGSSRPSVLQDHGWAGTPTFMAPEAHIGQPNMSSDWFSFGVLIYNLLTNSYPGLRSQSTNTKQTNWNNFGEAIQYDRSDMVKKLAGFPEHIVDLCVDLVTKPKNERPDGAKTLQSLGVKPQSLSTPMEILEPSLCIGRETMLAKLTSILHTSQLSRVAHACLLQGEIGLGKTTLLEHWISRLSERNLLKLQGRCYEGDHTPLRLLNLLLQDVIRRINHNDSRQSRILNAFAPDLTLTFRQIQVGDSPLKEPVLKPDDIDHAQRRRTSLIAFRRFLCELSNIQPILIVIDDAHHADEDSLMQLRSLLDSSQDEWKFNGLIVLASDLDEEHKLPPNKALSDWFSPGNQNCKSNHVVQLDRIDDQLGVQLMDAWAVNKTLSKETQNSLIQRAEGNIFLLRQLVRNELEDNRKHFGYRYRFAHLPAEIERVLQFIAVAGQPIGFYQLERTAKLPPERLLGYTMFLISEGWIRRIDRDGSALFEISHKLFRREIINSTDPDRLKRRHFRLARFIISETPTPWTRIAHHYEQADDHRKAAAAYYQAAIEAVEKGAFAEAETFLQNAEIPATKTQASNRSSVLSLKAQCLAGSGRSSEAAKIYDQLQLESSQAPDRHVNYGCAASEQWINAGAVHEGLGRLRRVLPEIGLSSSKPLTFTQRLQHLSLLRKLTRIDLDDDCKSLDDSERALSRVVTSLTFLDSQIGIRLAYWLCKRIAQNGNKRDRAEVLMRLGAMTFFRQRQKWLSHKMIWKGRQLARESRSIASRANGYFCLYQATIQRGKHRKARLFANKAQELYAQAGASQKWESCFLEWASLRCMWQEGQLSDVIAASQELRDRHQGNPEAMSQFWANTMQPVFSQLLLGDTEAAENSIADGKQAIRHLDFDSPRFFLWQTSILYQLYCGDAYKASQIFQRDLSHFLQQPIFRSENYRAAAHSIRSCIGLVGMRVRPTDPRFQAELRIGLKGLQRIPIPAFSVMYRALQVIARRACGDAVTTNEFDQCIKQLENNDYHLYAVALRWHKGLAFSQHNDVLQARNFFTRQHCVAPERLMDMILPLPTHTAAQA